MTHHSNTFADSLPDAWTGRVDGPNPDHALWYTTIQPLPDPADAPPGVALVGFASDEGISRNHGRPGAVDGPDSIRGSLGWLAVHDEHPRYDAGTVRVDDADLEGGHDRLARAVADIVAAGHLPVVLGGGHEAAFGSHKGLRDGLGGNPPTPAIVNLDAHLDLRQADRPNNGTPFRQIVELVGEDFDYTVLGVSPADNTRFLFDSAERLNVSVTLDDELAALSPDEAADLALKAAEEREIVHLSIDLDVMSAAVAPGVTSPAAVGVPVANIRAICTALAKTGKLRLVDVVELNPHLDVDKRTARVAARLIHEIAAAHLAAIAA
ncbi:formimidoylglutamase [Corynebacterium halotolerans]|uniref:Formimidoylglutamase n=1 Tax=Corynebacterium halotolerans YIM 70093 = DSM 44683 TaxID=1121362 RepID=M1MWQ9_9CORY|nr:formimidoylglutamase [Corynebacterium halotolerans]AGF72179.1 formimidoylglutamase [Corynebacterium halotolerans YIM 70093 = DSM 44683]